jgi:hypothetical protein
MLDLFNSIFEQLVEEDMGDEGAKYSKKFPLEGLS